MQLLKFISAPSGWASPRKCRRRQAKGSAVFSFRLYLLRFLGLPSSFIMVWSAVLVDALFLLLEFCLINLNPQPNVTWWTYRYMPPPPMHVIYPHFASNSSKYARGFPMSHVMSSHFQWNFHPNLSGLRCRFVGNASLNPAFLTT